MNARLLVKALHRPTVMAAPRVAVRAPAGGPALRLLGEGTDAILLRASPQPEQPTAESRLLRYVRARHIHREDRDLRMDNLRLSMGMAFQIAWREGRRPNLRLTRPMTLRPVGLP